MFVVLDDCQPGRADPINSYGNHIAFHGKHWIGSGDPLACKQSCAYRKRFPERSSEVFDPESYAKSIGGVWGGSAFGDEKKSDIVSPETNVQNWICKLRTENQKTIDGYTWTGESGNTWTTVLDKSRKEDFSKEKHHAVITGKENSVGKNKGVDLDFALEHRKGKLQFNEDDKCGVSFAASLWTLFLNTRECPVPMRLFLVRAPVDKTIFFSDRLCSSRDAVVVREITDPAERDQIGKEQRR